MVISRRDVPGKQGKVFGVSMEPSSLEGYVKDKLDEIQSSLLGRATSFRDRCIFFFDIYYSLYALFPCLYNQMLESEASYTFLLSIIDSQQLEALSLC